MAGRTPTGGNGSGRYAMEWTESDERAWELMNAELEAERPAHDRGLRLGFRGVFLRNFVEREMRFAARGWGKNAPRDEE